MGATLIAVWKGPTPFQSSALILQQGLKRILPKETSHSNNQEVSPLSVLFEVIMGTLIFAANLAFRQHRQSYNEGSMGAFLYSPPCSPLSVCNSIPSMLELDLPLLHLLLTFSYQLPDRGIPFIQRGVAHAALFVRCLFMQRYITSVQTFSSCVFH